MFNNGESFNSKLKVDIRICYLSVTHSFVSSADEDENPVDGPAPPRRHGYQARETAQPRGRGAKRGGGAKNRGGGKNGQKCVEGPQSTVPGGPPPVGPGNQFAVPPGAPGNTFYKGHL